MREFAPEDAKGQSAAKRTLPIYTDLWDCKAKLASQDNAELRREVLAFARLPTELAERFSCQPLVLSRHLATPNREFLEFKNLVNFLGCEELVLTMPNGRFSPSVNASKRRLGKLVIDIGHTNRCVTILDFGKSEGKPMTEVRCRDGTPFAAFHSDLLSELTASSELSVVDAGGFFAGEPPALHYQRKFALFTCLGILAENYVCIGFERAFTENIVLPAIEATIARFGCAPVITRLLPAESEADPTWEHYPAEALPYALRAARKVPRAL